MKEMLININGDFTKGELSVLDHGLLYGYGLFETMRAYEGKVFSASRHLDRLYASAAKIGMVLPWTQDELLLELKRSVAKISAPNLYIRLTLSKGTDVDGPLSPSFIIFVRPYEPMPPSCYQRGWSLATVTARKNSTSLLSRLKSLNYLENLIALQEAKLNLADEGLFLNELGYVAEGTRSNIFLVAQDRLITPSVETGILNGITRQIVLETATANGLCCEECFITQDMLASSDEVFCTNSLMEIMPVTRVDREIVGSGMLGTITQKLMQKYTDLVSKTI